MIPTAPRPPRELGWPLTGAILLFGAACWNLLLPLVADDLVHFNMPWYEHAVRAGAIDVFRAPWSNYTPPYLYALAALVPLHAVLSSLAVVKLLSALGTLALVGAAWRLLRAMEVPDAGRIACCVAALPSVVQNAAALGQCDAMVTAPLLLALAAAVRRRHRTMLAWCGLALAIKLQAILLAPFAIGLLLARRVPLRDWGAAPLAFGAAFVPAWLIGWPSGDLATIYVRQTEHFVELSRNAPNVWAVAQALGWGDPALAGLATAAAVGASAVLIATMKAGAARLTPPVMLRCALLAPLLTAGLLPRMHERYFFTADVLALIVLAVDRDRRAALVALLVQAGSMLGILAYTSGTEALAAVGAAAMIAATVLVARSILPRPANDNPLPLRAATPLGAVS